MARAEYFNLSIPAPRRLAMMRADFAGHAAKYPHCPEHVKPSTWRDVRRWGLHNWQSAFVALSAGAGQWYSHTGPEFRNEVDAYEVTDERDRGYYTDVDCHDTAIGIVASLTHGRFIAGYRWTSNDERIYFPQIFDDRGDAARMADEHARVFAESARDDSERYEAMTLAELDLETQTEELRKSIALRHRAKFGGFERVRTYVEKLRQARETLADATRAYERGY
jgi:hypothetical protein